MLIYTYLAPERPEKPEKYLYTPQADRLTNSQKQTICYKLVSRETRAQMAIIKHT